MNDDQLEILAKDGREQLIRNRCNLTYLLAADNFKELGLFLDTIENFIAMEEKGEVDHLAEYAQSLPENHRGEFWADHHPYWWDQIIAPQFRASFVVALMSAVEFHISAIVRDLGTVLETPVSADHLKGGIYDRTRRFISAFADFQKPPARSWELIVDLYAVRNIMVHRSGLVDGSDRQKRVEAIVSRFSGIAIRNGYLDVQREFCEFARGTGEQFILELCRELARTCKELDPSGM